MSQPVSQSVSDTVGAEGTVMVAARQRSEERRSGKRRKENHFRVLSGAVPVSLLSPPSEESTRGGPCAA